MPHCESALAHTALASSSTHRQLLGPHPSWLLPCCAGCMSLWLSVCPLSLILTRSSPVLRASWLMLRATSRIYSRSSYCFVVGGWAAWGVRFAHGNSSGVAYHVTVVTCSHQLQQQQQRTYPAIRQASQSCSLFIFEQIYTYLATYIKKYRAE